MGALLAILRLGLGALRGRGPARVALCVALASLAGAASGALPAVVGAALDVATGRGGGAGAGLAGALARRIGEASPLAAAGAAAAAAVLVVGLTVLAGRTGAELAGELTAALRVEMLRAALGASPRDVEAAGRGMVEAPGHAPPRPPSSAARADAGAPPGAPALNAGRDSAFAGPFKAPPGHEVVKLAIARDSALVADFAVAFLTGLPQAVVTLAVLAAELAASGMGIVLAGGVALFVASRAVADRASRRVAHAMRAVQHADVAVFARVGEALAGAEELRLLGAREQAVRELAGAARAVVEARRRFGRALAVSGQIRSGIVALAPLCVVLALGLSRGGAGAGEVGKLLLVVPLLLARLEALDALRAGLIERAPVLASTLALLRLPAYPPAPDGPPPERAGGAPAIVLEHVTFTPPGARRPLLDDVSLEIPAGAVVGLCGRSGSGKSTLLRLLLRLDEPTSGTISISGVDLRRIPPEQLPAIFGVVGQQSRPFERSVADNLALGLDPPPSPDRMREALRRVELDALAGERGLDTEVRALPPTLSGGEARRLLVARLLLRDPEIVVLDEPEAGLPSATAEALLRVIAGVAAGRTAVVATHAPHLLPSVFNVLLEDGRVAAVGGHAALAAESAPYRALLAEALKHPAG